MIAKNFFRTSYPPRYIGHIDLHAQFNNIKWNTRLLQ